MPKPPPADSPIWKVFIGATKINVLLFKLTKGKVGGGFGKVKVLLLHHVGRKSGDARTTPVNFEPDGANLVLIASKGGVDKHPAWYHNLMAAESAEVELPGGERRRVKPRLAADGEERDRLWGLMTASYPGFDTYQGHTTRKIPVVVLEPV